MKKLLAILITAILVVTCVVTLAACNNEGIVVWVGQESASFYQTVANEYIAKYNETHEEAFPFKITVKGVDSSSAAETVKNDPDAGPDIFTVPHDNLAKMIGNSPIISAITDPELLAQIEADNPDSFLEVIKTQLNGKEYTVAVPYISQALFLYYDKTQISAEEVKTWEGIMEAAKRADAKAMFPMGNDCYNLSLFTLARKIDSRDAEGNITSTSSDLVLYEGSTPVERAANVQFAIDQEVAVYSWAQRFFLDPNGGMLNNAGILPTVQAGNAISLVGGAWKYDDAKAAWGDNLAVAELPEFTITEADAYGSIEAGTVFKSGTFADCKVFCINGFAPESHADYLQDIIKYFSSKEIQERSFEQCANLPAYKNAMTEFTAMQADTLDAQVAAVQISMASYGIAQPFGFHNVLNNRYYSSGADTIIQDILMGRDSANNGAPAYRSHEDILAALERIQNIWLGQTA